MFYTYIQNNTGGHFTGPAKTVVVEASSSSEANDIAQRNGLYFDGDGDCPCCGNRWYEAYSDEGATYPSRYDVRVDENTPDVLIIRK